MDRFESIYQQWMNKAENSYDTLPANPNLTPSQIDLLLAYAEGVEYAGHGENIKEQIAAHAKLTDEQFMRIFNDKMVGGTFLTSNPNLTEKQIDLLYTHDDFDNDYLASYSKLTDEQFMRIFNDELVNNDSLAQNSNLTTEQIDLLYQSFELLSGDKDSLSQYSKLTDEQFMRFFHDESVDNDYLAQNPHITEEQIDLLYKTEGVDIDELAIGSKLTDEQFMRFFHDAEGDMRLFLAQNSNLTTEQIDLLYQTNDNEIKRHLATHSKLTDDQWRFFDDDTDVVKRPDNTVLREVSNYLQQLALNPSINPQKEEFSTGIFNWSW
jgi:uncharacterized protein YneF (UPF0154 family)